MSKKYTNYLKRLIAFEKESPIACFKLQIIASYFILLLILSLIANSLLLAVFAKYRCLRTNLNLLVMTLTALNLFTSIIEFSFVIPSNIQCRFVTLA